MEKTTRMDFIKTLKDYKKVSFGGVLNKKISYDEVGTILDKIDIDNLDYTEVEFTSNAMKRKTDEGYSWLYFGKGDEVHKHEGKNYIVYLYKKSESDYQYVYTMVYILNKGKGEK